MSQNGDRSDEERNEERQTAFSSRALLIAVLGATVLRESGRSRKQGGEEDGDLHFERVSVPIAEYIVGLWIIKGGAYTTI